MNTNKRIFFLIAIILIVSSFKFNALNKRHFSDEKFSYDFYIDLSKKHIKVKKNKTYYWYKSNRIFKNVFGQSGHVLHGEYVKKALKSHRLIEKGQFKYGLKIGTWKEWKSNGELIKIEKWKKGLLNGTYQLYDSNGKILLIGNYNNGVKQGKWINYQKGDTLYYNNDLIIHRKSLKEIFNKVFKKKEQTKTKKKKNLKVKKKHFWNKLFTKKKQIKKK